MHSIVGVALEVMVSQTCMVLSAGNRAYVHGVAFINLGLKLAIMQVRLFRTRNTLLSLNSGCFVNAPNAFSASSLFCIGPAICTNEPVVSSQ